MTKFGTLTPNGVVDEMEIDLNKVESDDPLAYAYGYFHGKTGKEKAKSGSDRMPSYIIPNKEKDEELAEEYVKGYNDGVKAR